jgi:META domain
MRLALLAALFFSVTMVLALAGEPFPFDSELMLDAVTPMPGSKRVPMLEIEDDGSASIDLWCTSLRAQAVVTEDSITIVPNQPDAGASSLAQCDAEHQASDTALLGELAQVTKWRRSGDRVEFSGPTKLRYRLMTN